MATFDFPIFTEKVMIKFKCPLCGAEVESEWFVVPRADLNGDTREKSLRIKDDCYAVCPKCGEVFDFTIGESIAGGEGWVDELPDSEIVTAIY